MLAGRKTGVARLLTEAELDAFVFFDLDNIRYLCGFTGTDGALVVAARDDSFLTDSRYQTQAQQQVTAAQSVCYRNKFDGIVTDLQNRGVRRIGFEAETVTVAALDELRQKGGDTLEWVPVAEPVRSLRTVKDALEIEALQRAAALNREAFEEVLPSIRPGVRECDIALALEFALKRRGGEAKAFDYIVASGARGAMPHGVASEKMLAAGELVTIDFGTRVEGYYSDETVTLAIGQVDGRLRQIFDVVLQAHDLAMAAVKPGLAICDLDAVAREHIQQQGYGEYFGHGLGHGVGLKIHEYPAVSSKTTAPLSEGMVITVEPGIYLPDIGGVRIEDTVLVTADGCRCLTRIPKQYKQLPG